MSHFPSEEYLRGYEDGQRLGNFVVRGDVVARGGLPELQRRVWDWCGNVFAERPGWEDKRQRVQRFIEEALELAQACDVPREDMERLVVYVYGRPTGEPRQELGGTVITLAALAECLGLDAEAAGFAEMERVESPEVSEKVRAKQKAKDAIFDYRKPPAQEFSIGVRVRRGPTWDWQDQDTRKGGTGIGIVVVDPDTDPDGWVKVKWDGSGLVEAYRVREQFRDVEPIV